MEQKPILQAKNISKKFPGVLALDGVNIDIYPGEVHVLIGENGAGKSTLSKIISGALLPDQGEILLEGQPIKIKNPLEAISYGIGSVHQELMLIPWLNVAQNIFINREPFRWKGLPFIDYKKMHEDSKELLRLLEAEIDTKTPAEELSQAQKQIVEICKLLALNPRILILDEPTASLSEREAKCLFKRIKVLCKQGVAVIYISHRMQELREIGDKVTVLRDGKLIGTGSMKDYSNDDLVKMMVGRGISQMYPRNRCKAREEVLRLEDVCIKNGPQHVNMVVKKGEIVGLAGLVGSGRTELMQVVFGIDKIESGNLYLNGEKIIPKSPYEMIQKGVSFIPEDRKTLGLALKLSVKWNMFAASLRKRFRILLKEKDLDEAAKNYINELNILTPSINKAVNNLSGGNQQKVVLAKWLDTDFKLLICDEPTRGIDVGAKVEVHTLLDQLVNKNIAIVMISSDLPEILGMSDRIYVMHQQRIVGHFRHEEATEDNVGKIMLGLGG